MDEGFEDFGDFGDPDLFADDFNVFEENQVFLDNEGGADEAESDTGWEDDAYEADAA